MAKKKRAKRAPKSQGVTINWGVVGLIVVIALLIGLWQMTDKSSAENGSGTLPKMVKNMQANIQINGDINVSWKFITPALDYKVVGWRLSATPKGAVASTNFDLALTQIGSTMLRGDSELTYYASVNLMPMVLATAGTVGLYPIVETAAYPSSRELKYSGKDVTAILDYKARY